MRSGSRKTSDDPRQPPEYLAVGRVVRPHGVRGALKVAAVSGLVRTLKPSMKVFLGATKEPVIVQAFRAHRDEFLLIIEGCTDREAADQWRGASIYVRFEETEPLPEDVFYHWQIIGLRVVTTSDENLGEIVEILETGANDVYIVRDPSGREIMLPAIEPVVQAVDLENGRMIVKLLPGLID